MRNYLEELKAQVIDIYNEFYKEQTKATKFTVDEKMLKDMLSDEYQKEEEGYFYFDYYEVNWKIEIRDTKRFLIFEKGGW